jgi:hypothetical protein
MIPQWKDLDFYFADHHNKEVNILSTLHVQLAKTKGFRRLIAWLVKKKIKKFSDAEDKRKQEDVANLRNFEFKKFSQNGEDGIIEEIFKRIGTQSKYFVEFGVEDGTECNTRYLLTEKGWSGLWMDGSKTNMEKAKTRHQTDPLQVDAAFITAENVVSLFEANKVPKDLDLLSIDIDGNDYWVLKALSEYKPRLLIVEYNASFLPEQNWVMPYHPNHQFDGTRYFGASLRALTELAQSEGYRLVSCDSQGVNAFFVRSDLLNSQFSNPPHEVEYHYCAPKYRGLFFGHPPRV